MAAEKCYCYHDYGAAMKHGVSRSELARVGLSATIWIAASIPLFAQFGADKPAAACAAEHKNDAARIVDFLFKTYQSDAGACLQVLSGGKVIFRRTLDSPVGFTLGQKADLQYEIPAIANGTDVTGRGRPNMIVTAYTGGAHCCMYHLVFELEPKFRLLSMVGDADDDLAHFERLADGHYYLITADWTFAYWWLSFAGSPFHSVILRFVNEGDTGSFHLALDKMQEPAPTETEWQKSLRDVRHELKLNRANMFNVLPDVLWQEVMSLIYTGHSDLAWRFLDEIGSDAQKDPYPDLADFCSKLKASPYWPDLKPALKNVPAACANAKPAR